MSAGNFYKGKFLRLSYDGATLFHAKSCGLSISTKLENIATKDTNGDVNIDSGYSWTLSTDCLVADKPAASTQIDFMDLIDIQIGASNLIDVEFTTGIVGDFIYKGQVRIASSDMKADNEGISTGSASFTGTGDLVKDIVVA